MEAGLADPMQGFDVRFQRIRGEEMCLLISAYSGDRTDAP